MNAKQGEWRLPVNSLKEDKMFNDLREFISRADEMGECQHIDGAAAGQADGRSTSASTFRIAGLANDYLLYCAVPDQFAQGGYEVGNTAHGQIEAGLVIGEEMMMARKLRSGR
jgi:hypothetical protein